MPKRCATSALQSAARKARRVVKETNDLYDYFYINHLSDEVETNDELEILTRQDMSDSEFSTGVVEIREPFRDLTAPLSLSVSLSDTNADSYVSQSESFKNSFLSPSCSDDSFDSDFSDGEAFFKFDSQLAPPLPCRETTFRDELAAWAVAIPAVHVNSLLEILKEHECFKHELPKDCRTLVRTPRNVNVIQIAPGTYYHLGAQDEIVRLLQSIGFAGTAISLFVNVDGLPISESSTSQFWPILAIIRLKGLTQLPFAIGLYHGMQKPADSNEFLSTFTEEIGTLMSNGFQLGQKTIYIERVSFLCDAPALAYILQIKNHNARHSCRKCLVVGERCWTDAEWEKIKNNETDEYGQIKLKRGDPPGRLAYLEVAVEARTDISFRARAHPEFHNGDSILEQLSIDMVLDFPVDPMHQVYIGVTRKWIDYNVTVNGFKLSPRTLNSIKTFMDSLGQSTPHEFARSSRNFDSLSNWKATELRQFLLYTGPVIMRSRLSKENMNISCHCM